MSRLAPLTEAELPAEIRELMSSGHARMGFRANDGLTFARVPAMIPGLMQLVAAVYGPKGLTPLPLRKLVAYVTSTAAGCIYCRSHTAHGAFREGVAPEKIAAAWDYDTSPLFTPAERAALRLAHHAGFGPVQVTDDDFAALRVHFSSDAIAELVAVIALFGFLNKWNAVIATDLEDTPMAILREKIEPLARTAD